MEKSDIRQNLLNELAHLTVYSKDEALSIFFELDLNMAQYDNMRCYLIAKNCLLLP